MDNNETAEVLQYEREYVLNAIYDVIDSLGISAEHINSERGVIIVKAPESERIRITVERLFPKGNTKIGVISEDNSKQEWISIFFDELKALLKSCEPV